MSANVVPLPFVKLLSAGSVVFPIANALSSPYLKPGEFAVVDTRQRDPVIGDLFVIEWISGRKEVVQVSVLTGCTMDDDSVPLCVGSYTCDQVVQGQMIRMMDGPYSHKELKEKMVGRVVGRYLATTESSPRVA